MGDDWKQLVRGSSLYGVPTIPVDSGGVSTVAEARALYRKIGPIITRFKVRESLVREVLEMKRRFS